MLALLLGSVLAVLALAYVMLPLLRGAATRAEPVVLAPELPPEASALEALREIEFDQATGKLSPEDYATLKATYTPKALAELKVMEAAVAASRPAQTDATAAVAGVPADAAASGSAATASGSAPSLDPAEAMIARARQRALSCPEHGPRPESDAMFCSDCGRYLGKACISCGATVSSETARFCTECGSALAA